MSVIPANGALCAVCRDELSRPSRGDIHNHNPQIVRVVHANGTVCGNLAHQACVSDIVAYGPSHSEFCLCGLADYQPGIALSASAQQGGTKPMGQKDQNGEEEEREEKEEEDEEEEEAQATSDDEDGLDGWAAALNAARRRSRVRHRRVERPIPSVRRARIDSYAVIVYAVIVYAVIAANSSSAVSQRSSSAPTCARVPRDGSIVGTR
jgi:hypothetical protein